MNIRSLFIGLLLLPMVAWGQQAGGIVVRNLDANAIDAITNLSVVDGRLYFCSSQLLYSAPITREGTATPEVALEMMAIDAEMNYVVRHPVSHVLFFTKVDASGRSRLYELDTLKHKVRPVRIGRFQDAVVHPVFSEDGSIMVFSSDSPIGFGGYDLWYSLFENGRWQDPQNMGHRVNSSGNEIAPTIAWGMLYFSSDYQPLDLSSAPHYRLFATCLVPQQKIFGDTICQFPIGRGTVQPLAAPFDGPQHQLYFALDSMGERGFWVSRALGKSPDYQLHAFFGRPDCVRLSGSINALSQKRARTSISVSSGEGESYVTSSDEEGHYCLYLSPNRRYQISFAHPDCFATPMDFFAARVSSETLYDDQHRDIVLAGFALDQTLSFSNADPNEAFFLEGSADLTAAGRSLLDQVVLFLQQNKHISLTVTLVQQPISAAEQTYCELLNESRIASIRNYFIAQKLGLQRVSSLRFASVASVAVEPVSGTCLLFE